ncbi:MAG: universal stress protein [Nitrosopumilaceae archaeon]|nr:universal stress protein [Nitrosopumilaceae archaeon]
MNIYEKDQLKCSICGKIIGEVDTESTIIFPLCGKCNRKEKKIAKKGIEKILVPVDLSEKSYRALDIAIYLSKHLGSKITVLQVIPPVKVGKISFVEDVFKQVQSVAQKSIKEAMKYCEEKNTKAHSKIVKGEEADQIVKVATKSSFDLIVMGSSGKEAVRELVFGSISNYVMHNSNIPVLTVKEKSPKMGAKIKKTRSKTKPKK